MRPAPCPPAPRGSRAAWPMPCSLADALPLAADTPPEAAPPDGESFSAVAPQPPLIAPPPVEPGPAPPSPPAGCSNGEATPPPQGLFPERPPPPVPGWFDIARPETPGGKVLDRVERPSLVEDRPASDETANQRRRVPLPEAVRCFDRGLSLLQDKLFAAALEEWERAAVLDPDNRMYQVNLKRLRQRVSNPTSPNPRSVVHEHEKRESQ